MGENIFVRKMFKEFLQLSLFVALVVARNSSEESDEEMEKSEGLCMEPEEVVYWCTAGTPLGEKLMESMSTCSGAEEQEEKEEPAGRKKGGKKCKKGKKCKGKGKGKGKKCPSVDEVEAWFMEEHQAELCVFSELGWLDNSGNWSEAAAEADLAKMGELATATAGIQCFLHMFQDSCKDFVGGKVYEALYSSLVPLAG